MLAPRWLLPGALAAALVLALDTGQAAAQDSRVCTNIGITPVIVEVDGTVVRDSEEIRRTLRAFGEGITESPHYSIYCRYGRADRYDRVIAVNNPQIVVVDDFVPGIEAFHEGIGDVSIYVSAVSGIPGPAAGTTFHPSPTDYGQGIFTTGNAADFITGEDSYGIHAKHHGEGRAGIDVRNISVRTTGDYAHGIYAWQQGSYIFVEGEGDDPGTTYRARGAVVVNLIETERDRADRVRPLVATRGDSADAVRAQYTRAAARGHIAVTVEGYTLATGGIVPIEAITVSTPSQLPTEFDPTGPRIPNPDYDPDDPTSLQFLNFDPSRPSIPNPDYDSGDPNSPRFINVYVRDKERFPGLVAELRPYSVVYLPVRNPDYDPDDTNSRPFSGGGGSDIAIWNGRHFLAQNAIQAADVAACQGMSTAAERRTCYSDRIAERSRTEGNIPTGFNARGIHASHEGHGDIRIRATDSDIKTWGAEAQGIYAIHTGRTLSLRERHGSETVVTPGGGGISIVVTGGTIETGLVATEGEDSQGEDSHGIWALHRGDSGADSDDGTVDPDDIGTGNIAISVTGATINTFGAHARGVFGLIQQTCAGTDADGRCNEFVAGTGVGDIDIAIDGGAIATQGVGGAYAVQARHENTGNIALRVTGVAATTEGDQAHAIFAEHTGTAGTVSVTVDGGSVATQGDGAHAVYGDHAGAGALTVAIADGATVATAGAAASGVRAALAGDGALTVAMAGEIATAGEGSDGVAVLHRGSGALTIAMTGGAIATTGDEAHGIQALHSGSGALAIRMTSGTVTAGGAQAHGIQAIGSSAGTVSIAIDGGAVTARGDTGVGVLADGEGGAVAVTVAEGASVTGGLTGIQLASAADADGNLPARQVMVMGTVTGGDSAGIYLLDGGAVTVGVSGRVSATSGNAIVSDGAGDLVATVAGRVAGDVRAQGDGALMLNVMTGGVVTGTVHDASPITVAGSIGRLLYSSGGAVTVAASGRLTGIEGEAIRSAAGGLSVTMAGAATGDIRAQGGDLTLRVMAGGMIDGDLIGERALNAIVSGTVTGDILGRGTGDHTVTVAAGGSVTGTVHLAASTVAVAGTAGQVRLDRGGVVTVAAGGRLAGIEGVAIRSASGDLTANLAGTLAGDVLAQGTGVHRVTVAAGGNVAGTVRVATPVGLEDTGSMLVLNGAVGRVVVDRGGTFQIGPEGRIRGIDDVAVSSTEGAVVVVLRENPDEMAGEGVDRIQGRIVAPGGRAQVRFQPADGGEAILLGDLNTTASTPSGPYDLGVVRDPRGGIRVVRDFAPRARVYEAMPSLLLGLNALPTRSERMAAERNANGAWALVEAGDGAWNASRATAIASSVPSSDIAYDYRRYGVRAGIEMPLADDGPVVGIFVHHRRISADLAWSEGKIETRGTGFGLSASWKSGDGTYLDGQLQGTWHEADLTSERRGVMKSGATGAGYALAIEAGRRLATFGDGRRAVALVPRARLVSTRVDMDDFTDAVGSRISLKKGRSLVGRAGLGMEAQPPMGNGRLFASLDVERAFSSQTRVDVAGVPLISEPEETWLRAQLGGAFQWDQGRYALQGALSYGTAGRDNRDLGGNMSLSVRF